MTGNMFDTALHEVGEFGLYQKRLLVLLAITVCTVLLHNQSPVFTMKIPRHRCKIPGLANDTYEVQNSQHATLINVTIPVDDDGDYSKCSMYDVTGNDDETGENRTVVKCDDWVFDKSVFKSSYVTELKLVCHNKQYRSHSTMMIFAGKFAGAFCNSAGGDYFGRRRIYLVMLMALTSTAVGLLFVSSLPALMVLRFLAGATTTGIYLPMYIIALELMGTSRRRVVGIVSRIFSMVADALAILTSFMLRDWRYFHVCLIVPCSLAIIGFYFLPESPRWLVSKGRLAEAQKLIDHIAKVNGVEEPPRLQEEAVNYSGPKTSVGKVTPFQLFRVPRLFLRYTLLYLIWILMMMCTYGLKLNVTNMSGDFYINITLMESMDIIALLIFTFLIERMGRRAFLLTAAMLGGLACLATIVPTLLDSNEWIPRGLSFAGKMCVSCGLSAMYIMSPELFPTVLRSFGLGSCSMMSRIGGLASPYVADLNTYVGGVWGSAVPQIVFGVAGILTAIMVFFLPETRGRLLPETVRDAVEFGRSVPEVIHSAEMTITPFIKEQENPVSKEAREAIINGTRE